MEPAEGPLSLRKLGHDVHMKFREMARESMQTDDFWLEIVKYTLEQADRLRKLHE